MIYPRSHIQRLEETGSKSQSLFLEDRVFSCLIGKLISYDIIIFIIPYSDTSIRTLLNLKYEFVCKLMNKSYYILYLWPGNQTSIIKRLCPIVQMLIKCLFVTCLLVSQWPKHITWPSLKTLWN